jgi:AcrR family transcriptional regulator
MTPENDAPVQAASAVTDGQQDKRNHIIERAIIMFNQLGYDRVRVSDITDSLSMGKGTFYLYFRNKKDLLLRCFDHVGEFIQELESLPQIQQGDFFDKVGPRVENIGLYDWFPGLVNLLRTAELSPDLEIKAKAREAYEALAGPMKHDLRAAIEAGSARDVDPDLAVYGFIGMAENLWFRARFDDRFPSKQVIQFMTESTKRLLSSGECGVGSDEPGLDRAVHLVCADGTQFDLDHVHYNGKEELPGFVGQAAIDISPGGMSRFVIDQAGDDCLATLVTIEGDQVAVRTRGSVVVSGETTMGTVRVAMRDVASLTPLVRQTSDDG